MLAADQRGLAAKVSLMRAPPVVLTIAGFDPSSGAGISADLKTFAAHGCYGVAAITSLTVQSTRGVKLWMPVSPDILAATLAELANDFPIAAVKIGMLGSEAAARAVVRFLRQQRPAHVVLDPVLRSSSGARLIQPVTQAAIVTMFPLVELITPNAAEAAALSKIKIRNVDDMRRAAARLQELGTPNVVVTGGDMKHGSQCVDLFAMGGMQKQLRGPRIISRSTHGTGCVFSSAIAANLAHGRALPQAVTAAKKFVANAIRRAPQIGNGCGPVL
jgi:hydroxymethylpyrimidine kinase/phosphomethylpyrimidine kinase